ncbi:hypothetical protein HNY73_015183 [Argiope bruennichi]|uniref:Uncharacterized protein n=1 Tax=Argiope bruennichi TaxID=94029 RepID=A0A8T0ERB6_ARGBR|nr:hypothetical protein HNY73_015183 [Argiope bruennichi]
MRGEGRRNTTSAKRISNPHRNPAPHPFSSLPQENYPPYSTIPATLTPSYSSTNSQLHLTFPHFCAPHYTPAYYSHRNPPPHPPAISPHRTSPYHDSSPPPIQRPRLYPLQSVVSPPPLLPSQKQSTNPHTLLPNPLVRHPHRPFHPIFLSPNSHNPHPEMSNLFS